MKLISFLLRYSRGLVILAVIASIISGFCNAGLITVIHAKLSRGESAPAALGWAFAVLCIALPVTRFASQVLLTHLSQKAIFDLRMRLVRSIVGAPLRHLERVGAHRLLGALTEDVFTITGALTSIPSLGMHGVIVIGCLLYLGWLSWVGLLVVLGVIAVGMLSFRQAVIRGGPFLTLARQGQDALFGHFRALTEGIKELKLHRGRRDAFLTQSLEPTAAAYQRQNLIGNSFYSAAGNWALFLDFGLIGLLLFVLPRLINISLPALIGYTIIILYMLGPLDFLLSIGATMGRANVAFANLESLRISLVDSSTEEDAVVGQKGNQTWKSLKLIGVSHTYHRERENTSFTLGPIDLTLHTGELVFLVGGNGSGKTTLAKILVGLYSPEAGQISIDGEPVTDKNREQYRQFFSAVFSDFFLFDSLLGLAKPELDEQAKTYLSKLQLDRKVEVENGNLSTTELSQGQRKRLALLTAYLEDRPIYVFDEWAADQDSFFRDVFYHQILHDLKSRGKTVVVISHDDRYYHLGDRVIKLDYGQLEYDKAVLKSVSAELPLV